MELIVLHGHTGNIFISVVVAIYRSQDLVGPTFGLTPDLSLASGISQRNY